MKPRPRGYTLIELIVVLFMGAVVFIGFPTVVYVLYHFIAKYW